MRKQRNGSTRTKRNNRTTERLNRKENWAARLAQKEWMQRAMAKVAADEWWSKSSSEQRRLAMTIALMMAGLKENRRIEIRLDEGAVKARFIHLLNRPEKGCLSAILLPEIPTEPWN